MTAILDRPRGLAFARVRNKLQDCQESRHSPRPKRPNFALCMRHGRCSSATPFIRSSRRLHPTSTHDPQNNRGNRTNAPSAATERALISGGLVRCLCINRMRLDRSHVNRSVTRQVRRYAHGAGVISRFGWRNRDCSGRHPAGMHLECVL
jgi:hypothetical protein